MCMYTVFMYWYIHVSMFQQILLMWMIHFTCFAKRTIKIPPLQGCAQDDLSGSYFLAKVDQNCIKCSISAFFMLRWWCKTRLNVAEWWLGRPPPTNVAHPCLCIHVCSLNLSAMQFYGSSTHIQCQYISTLYTALIVGYEHRDLQPSQHSSR